MILVLLFLVFFGLGPFCFWVLARGRPIDVSPRMLLGSGLFCAGLGLAFRFGLAGPWGQAPVVTIAGIALLWCAWIAVLAYGAQRLRRADGTARMWRLTGVVGAAGATVPWFGLAAAHFING